VVVSAALLILFVPVAQESAGDTMVGPRLYSYERETLFGDGSGGENVTYRGVTFGFHVCCAVNVDVGTVCGNATGPDGVPHAYALGDGVPREGPPSWETWDSPDHPEAVE
jgi:hypothetical protein